MPDTILAAFDSLNQVHLTLSEYTELLNQSSSISNEEVLYAYEQYYNRVFEFLMWLIIAAFTVFAFLIPLVLRTLQKRDNKKTVEDLEKRLKDGEVAIAEKVYEKIKLHFSTQLDSIEASLENNNHKSEGGIYHIQALLLESDKDFAGAILSSLISASHYILVDDHYNTDAVWTVITENIDNLTKADLDRDTNRKKINDNIEIIEKRDVQKIYHRKIIALQESLRLIEAKADELVKTK